MYQRPLSWNNNTFRSLRLFMPAQLGVVVKSVFYAPSYVQWNWNWFRLARVQNCCNELTKAVRCTIYECYLNCTYAIIGYLLYIQILCCCFVKLFYFSSGGWAVSTVGEKLQYSKRSKTDSGHVRKYVCMNACIYVWMYAYMYVCM